jgi:tRNA threonylcarbamoyl adenosine modification protein (Sua5/YciO/YrdC/YwlC family)
MADKIKLHPVTPHQQRVFEIVDRLRAGDVMLMPTDTQYALVCVYSNKRGMERMRSIRNLKKDHLFTLLIDGLNGVSKFAHLSDSNFKVIRRLIPGPYTFVLPGTRQVPRLLMHPSRKTIGIKVPDNPICQQILAEIGEPLLATTAKLPDSDTATYLDTQDLFTAFERHVDLFIDDELPLSVRQSTVVEMMGDEARLLRKGDGMDALEYAFAFVDQPYVEL